MELSNQLSGAYLPRVRAFIVENFLFGEAGQFQDDDSLLDRGIIDSSGILELVSWIEASYGVRIEDSEMLPENLDAVVRIAAFVERKLGVNTTEGRALCLEQAPAPTGPSTVTT